MVKKLLVVAPIGDPAVWRMSCYVVDGYNYLTCCSAIALTLSKVKEYEDIDLLLVSTDSLVCSEIMGEFKSANMMEERRRIPEVLTKLFRDELANAARRINLKIVEQDGEIWIEGCHISVRAAIAQSSGQYPVNRANAPASSIYFNGDPTAVFAKIVNAILPHKDVDVLLDLTHGVNYFQTMAMYAVEAFKAFNRNRITVFNSSPYPQTHVSPRCFSFREKPESQAQKIEKEPLLKIFNVSALLKISDLTSSFSQAALNQNNVETIKEAVTMIAEKYGWHKFVDFARHVTLGWYYLTCGIITFGYFHSARSKMLSSQVKKVDEILYEMEKSESKLSFNRIYYYWDGVYRGEVTYNNSSDWRYSIPFVVWSLHNELCSVFNPEKESEVSIGKLKSAASLLSKRNPLYTSMLWRLSYEAKKIKGIQRKLKRSELEIIRERGLRKALFRTAFILSSLPDKEVIKRHLISHAGITCEPVSYITFTQPYETILKLELGRLGDDPLSIWKT
ncbi:MAG: TM1812 family CRISPR-associated protein [Candidatus Bathyarchaeia archaeon]